MFHKRLKEHIEASKQRPSTENLGEARLTLLFENRPTHALQQTDIINDTSSNDKHCYFVDI